MIIARTIAQLQEAKRGFEGSIGFVPTMGAFHEGHLSLMREARRCSDKVVVSLFVNPTQFGAGEDLDAYPRDLEGDLAKSRAAGAHLAWVPETADLYPPGYQTRVEVTELSRPLCGVSRPVHFSAVATVVTKLFHVVEPDVAVFGEKDFQQLQVVRRLVQDLDFDIEILPGPTVREPDGLAMSSRNSYLSPEEREQAVCLVEGVRLAKRLYNEGERSCGRLRQEVSSLISGYPLARTEYVELVDSRSLARVETADDHTLLALAVRVGSTRLIDNTILADRDSP